MGRLLNLLSEIQRLQDETSEVTSRLSQVLKMSCPTTCGKCCENPRLMITVLDCLPLAVKVLRENVDLEEFSGSSLCVFYGRTKGTQGLCGAHAERPTLCRLFGYSARLNKYAAKEMVLCSELKERFQNKGTPETAPIMEHYGRQLQMLDPILGNEWLPFNEALTKAVELLRWEMSFESQQPRPVFPYPSL